MPFNQLTPGIQNNADNQTITARSGKQGETMVSELHGRFYEQNYRNNLFGSGMTLTSISNVTFTSATTGVTATPIAGVYNPLSSPVNLVILQAKLGVTMTNATATGPGGFVWMVATGNNAITTGAAPYNRKTLAASGSYAKNMSGVALTGMTGTLVVVGGSALGGGSAENVSFVATAAGMQVQYTASVENVDGAWIVPPGGVLALMATTTPVAHSAASDLVWEEVPI